MVRNIRKKPDWQKKVIENGRKWKKMEETIVFLI